MCSFDIVVPLRLRQLQDFRDETNNWLLDIFGVNPQQVVVLQSSDAKDKGIDVSKGSNRRFIGEYYFHFTVFRGVGAAGESAPQDLRSGKVLPMAEDVRAGAAV